MYSHHPYKRKVIGSADVISTISREEILEFFNNYYAPSNMITVVVGDIDTSKAVEKITKAFNSEYKKPVKKNFVKETVSSEPVNKVIKKGTKSEILAASSRGENSRQSSKRKHMSVEASAYTGHGITSTGTKPKWGTIAVDPSVIPYGTKVYIPQFNKTFIAEDCGGAIKGNKIDIYMNDELSCHNFGRKVIDIYIVE
jgi:3D (Asp-Asp-Asp) domain-containing protein